MRTIVCILFSALIMVFTPACAHEKNAAKNAPKNATVDPDDLSPKGLSQDAAKDYYYLIALDLVRQGREQEAIQALTKLIELDPLPDFYCKLAALYWNTSPDKAQTVLTEGLAKHPGDKGLRLCMANALLLERRLDEAIKELQDLRAAYPDDQSILEELAEALTNAGRFKEALHVLAAASTPSAASKSKGGKGKHAPARALEHALTRTAVMAYTEARAYAGLGDKKKAKAKYEEALKIDPSFLPALATQAAQYENDNNVAGALSVYRHMLEVAPRNKAVWLGLIRLSLKAKDASAAREYLKKAPPDNALFVEALNLFSQANDEEGALKAVTLLGAQNPGNPEVIFLETRLVWQQTRDVDRVMALLAQIPKDSPAYGQSLSARIQLALDNDLYDLAKPLIDEGKKAFPDDIGFWFSQASLQGRQDDLAGAVKTYRKAAKKWPDNDEALYRLALALSNAGNEKESILIGEKLLAKHPDDPEVQNFVGYALAEAGQDLDRALELISKAVAAKPDNLYYQDSLAWALFKRGDTAKAWEAIQKAVAGPHGPKQQEMQPEIWEHYGDIARAMNLPQEAAKGYTRALELKPDNAPAIKKKLEEVQQ